MRRFQWEATINAQLKFRCGECGELHDDQDSAVDCCPPHISETWVCESCGSENFRQDEADACCPQDDPQSPEAYRREVEQLEAAGQKRLIP